MKMDIDKVSVIIFTENSEERQKYFNLFKLILDGKIEIEINSKDRKELDTSDLRIKFLLKSMNSRAHKAHYVLNLTQDEVFDQDVAQPMTVIHSYLKQDEKWSMLFDRMEDFKK